MGIGSRRAAAGPPGFSEAGTEGAPRVPGWGRHWGAIALLAGAAVGAVVVWRAGALDLVHVRSSLAAAGPRAIALFVLGYATLTLLPAPKNVLSIAAGAVFGLGPGVGAVWAAAMLGSLAAFAIARMVDPSALGWAAGRHRRRVEAVLDRHGLAAVLVLRLVPVAPFTAVNYLSGMSSVRGRDYAWGTAVGIIPGTVAYVAVGALGVTSPSSLAGAGSVLVVLLVAGSVLVRRFRAQPPGSGR